MMGPLEYRGEKSPDGGFAARRRLCVEALGRAPETAGEIPVSPTRRGRLDGIAVPAAFQPELETRVETWIEFI